MSYDEKIKRAETIIAQLEQAEALGMDEYKHLASEAEALLNQCKEELTTPYATYDGKPEER
jgi:exonuclease VII small subunit